jgi:NAD(P)-dependent dehydrogenase (short-subunit alcohol dehydrogenase family)
LTGALTGREAVVVAWPGALADRLRDALEGAGAGVTVLAPPADDVAAYRQAFASGPAPDVAVFAAIDPDWLDPRPVVGMDDAEWDRRAEAPMRAALWTAQAAFPHLRQRDGRLILVCPTVAMEGAAGIVPFAAAAEGQRQLAKSAARRWGAEGITVNVVSPGVSALVPALAGADAGRVRPSLPDPGADPLAGVASAVVWLASREAAAITGATIGADDGALLAP